MTGTWILSSHRVTNGRKLGTSNQRKCVLSQFWRFVSITGLNSGAQSPGRCGESGGCFCAPHAGLSVPPCVPAPPLPVLRALGQDKFPMSRAVT